MFKIVSQKIDDTFDNWFFTQSGTFLGWPLFMLSSKKYLRVESQQVASISPSSRLTARFTDHRPRSWSLFGRPHWWCSFALSFGVDFVTISKKLTWQCKSYNCLQNVLRIYYYWIKISIAMFYRKVRHDGAIWVWRGNQRIRRSGVFTACITRLHVQNHINLYMGVSKNRGTPKSFILIGFSIINHPFWSTRVFGNTHI